MQQYIKFNCLILYSTGTSIALFLSFTLPKLYIFLLCPLSLFLLPPFLYFYPSFPMLLPQFLSFHSSVSFFNTIVCLFILLFPYSIINFFFSNISSTFLFFLLPCTVLYVLFSLFLSHLSFHTFIPSLPFLFSNFFFFFRFLCPSHYAPIAGMWIFLSYLSLGQKLFLVAVPFLSYFSFILFSIWPFSSFLSVGFSYIIFDVHTSTIFPPLIS